MRETIHIIRTGEYKTRAGQLAIIVSIGTDGKAHGRIPGSYSFTWWTLDGRHNFSASDDIVAEERIDSITERPRLWDHR